MKKATSLVFLLFLLAGQAGAQCLSGDCKNGNSILLYPNGERYIGQFWDGKLHGDGIYYYSNGSRYQGQWSQDQPHGQGVRWFPDGTRLSGVWENGKLIRRMEMQETEETYSARGGGKTGCISGNCYNGKGIYIYPSGAIYIGEFSGGEIHGVGVCYYSDGSKYQGQWQHRYPEGRGAKTYPDGRVRTGFWKMGQPVDQYGNFALSEFQNFEADNDGSEIQTGCIAGDCLSGQGTFGYADGSRYEGQFFNGMPEGWGTHYYIDGRRYVGAFKEGHPHGKGKLEKPDGSVQTGEWRQGRYLSDPAGNITAGCVDGNCDDGYGTFLYTDGSKYVGTFKNRAPHGWGTVIYANGDRYEGQMAEASFNGQGTLFLNDGKTMSGRWKNGAFLGASELYAVEPATTGASGPFIRTEERPDHQTDAKVWAVIIGVAAYNHMPVLRYTDDDAYRIYAFLKSPEGGALDDSRIRILIDEDATKSKIVEAMNATFGKAGPNDLVLLYFSGHGLKGSFLPIDFDGFNNKLYHEEINDILENSNAKLKLCIADACHSGSLLAMRDGPSALLSYYEHLANAKAGTALIMSSKSDETSLESSGLRQGVFSHYLIRGLKGEADRNKDDAVSVEELYQFIFSNVRAYTGNRQSPMIQGDYDNTTIVSVKR